jgi:hypothetical protein
VRDDETPPLPPIRTVYRSQLADELAANADDESSGTESDEVVARMQADNRAVEQAFVALRLVTGEMSLGEASVAEQASSVAAFYRDDVKDVTIVSDAAMDREQAMNVLAHEFTHYLQDRAGQLGVAREQNISLDETVARRSLVEGEAVVVSYRASAAMRGLSYRNVRWSSLWASLERSIAAATEASSSPLLAAANQLPYVVSPPVIESTWESSRAGVDALFDDPPPSVVDWLLPKDASQSRAEPLDCYPALPPDGYRLAFVETLGPAGAFAMLATQERASLDAVSEWRQDLLAIYVEASSEDGAEPNVLAMWRMRFADDQSARAFANILAPLGLAITTRGRELAIRVSREGDGALEALDVDACPSQTELAAMLPKRNSMPASVRNIGARVRARVSSRPTELARHAP